MSATSSPPPSAVPLIARVYPSGSRDVNEFHAAGGMAYVIRELLDAGLAHDDVLTVAGPGLRRYQEEPFLEDGRLVWREGAAAPLDRDILRPVSDPFLTEGGMKLLTGGLGRAVIKTSAMKPQHLAIEAPARVTSPVPSTSSPSRAASRNSQANDSVTPGPCSTGTAIANRQ